MKRDSNSIIPKIILILGSVSILGIILLFFLPRDVIKKKRPAPDSPEELFSQVMQAAHPQIIELWEEGDKFITKKGFQCPKELEFQKAVGRSYYQCQPHFWQCYWENGIIDNPEIKIDIFGQEFHLRARPVFASIPAYSEELRFYEMTKTPGLKIKYGYVVEMEIRELPGKSQSILLSDSCRDTYLPQRIYGYGSGAELKGSEGFIWDNFGRNLFLDKFYVTNQQVNEWRVLTGETSKIMTDPKIWPYPALLSLSEQKKYCNYFGKKVLEAKLFDAATMTPGDLKNPKPEKVFRPQTPWQRDLSKTFLGTSRINEDYQLAPLDCLLAQVKGCPEKLFTTDSVSWMGLHYGLGFYPEHFINSIDPDLNLKMSSKFMSAASKWHELGLRTHWNGEQQKDLSVAFRCYEELVP